MSETPEIVVDNQTRKNDILFMKISYICVIVFPIITLIYALIKYGEYKKDSVLFSHMRWQLGTLIKGFVYGLLLILATILLAFVTPVIATVLSIGLYLLLMVWVLFRVVKGFMFVTNNQEIK